MDVRVYQGNNFAPQVPFQHNTSIRMNTGAFEHDYVAIQRDPGAKMQGSMLGRSKSMLTRPLRTFWSDTINYSIN